MIGNTQSMEYILRRYSYQCTSTSKANHSHPHYFDVSLMHEVLSGKTVTGRQTLSRQIKTLPDRHLQKGTFPFWLSATSTDYISQIGAQPAPHDRQRNQQ